MTIYRLARTVPRVLPHQNPQPGTANWLAPCGLPRRLLRLLRGLAFGLTLALALTGCDRQEIANPTEPAAKQAAKNDRSATDAAHPGSRSGEPTELQSNGQVSEQVSEQVQAVTETWDLVFMHGQPIGHAHTRVQLQTPSRPQPGKLSGKQPTSDSGVAPPSGQAQQSPMQSGSSPSATGNAPCNAWTQTMVLHINRFNAPLRQTVKATSHEKCGGGLLTAKWQSGNDDSTQSGTVTVSPDGNTISLASDGSSDPVTLAWNPGNGGYFAVEQSLRDEPMSPGQSRTITGLLPMLNQTARFTLTAKEYETVKLLDSSRRLLHIDSTIDLMGAGKITATLWADPEGAIWKQTLHQLNQTTIRTTRQRATTATTGQFDLGVLTTVRLIHDFSRLPDLHQPEPSQQRAVYHIRYTVPKPGASTPPPFPSDGCQRATARNQTLVLEVSAHPPVPGAALPNEEQDGPPALDPSASRTKPDQAAMASSHWINTSDPDVQKLAQRACAKLVDPAPMETARCLEHFVHQFIQKKNYSQLMLTAREVAQQKQGDCTEHAVLLAALCRAQHVPARVVIGLVHVPSAKGFAYHMWNEVWTGQEWTALDATIGRGAIGLGHLKVKHSNLNDQNALSDFLPVAQLAGQIEIELKELGPPPADANDALTDQLP